MDIAGPIAKISSILINWLSFVKFISNSSNRIPSPVTISAIPCKEASVRSFVNKGNSLNLKS